jgi:hypothetical protein
VFCWQSKFILRSHVEEQRKRAILFAANAIVARKLIEWTESDKPNLAKKYLVDGQAVVVGGVPKCRSAIPVRRR